MMRAVRRHPSEFRPEALRANAAIPGSARSVPGQRSDLAVFDLVNLMLDGGTILPSTPVHLPW
jgi:hypothetical protein